MWLSFIRNKTASYCTTGIQSFYLAIQITIVFVSDDFYQIICQVFVLKVVDVFKDVCICTGILIKFSFCK
jgi:hypothetical protein